jgi:hypothetical protein
MTSQVGLNPVSNKLVSIPGTPKRINLADLYSSAVPLTVDQMTSVHALIGA